LIHLAIFPHLEIHTVQKFSIAGLAKIAYKLLSRFYTQAQK
jgi:hypothetical protein